MSVSMRPHRRQPTRLPRPWDSPGKNTGVGCHFLLQCMKVKSLSRVWLLAIPWTAAYQAPPSMGFSRQEYWSGVPLPSPGRLPTPVLFWPEEFHGLCILHGVTKSQTRQSNFHFTQNLTNFGKFFKMHADMTIFTIQSNKTVLNDVKERHY